MSKISIGLPVYNGEEYLIKSIDSILNQTFVDFELIISDNASNDATSSICQNYIHRDQRIKYYRQKSNIGLYQNFKFVFEKSNSDYFIWASHDDIWHPDWLKKLYDISKQKNELTFGIVQFIDESENEIKSTANLRKLEYVSNIKSLRLFRFICDPWIFGKMSIFHGLYPRSCININAMNTLIDGNFNNDLYFVYEVLKITNIRSVNVKHYKRVHSKNDSIINSKTKISFHNKHISFLFSLLTIKYFNLFIKRNKISTKIFFLFYSPLIPYYILKNIFFNIKYQLLQK